MKKLLLSIFFCLITFSLFAQNITVTFPNGNEHWIQNTYAPHNIEWQSSGVTAFKIEFSSDNGTSWTVIEPSFSGANFYSWTSANVISTSCLLKVTDANGTISDQSDATFTISNQKIYFAQWNTTLGPIRAELRGDIVPTTAQNFINLAEKGFYTNLIFHRVIPNFMIQDGDPLGTGFGDPGYSFNDEFSPLLRHNFPGVLSMANSGPNTNGSQYFITTVPTAWLNDVHTIFGRVIDGMQTCYDISNVPRDANDKPLQDVGLTISIVQGTPTLALQIPAAAQQIEAGRMLDINWNSDFTADVRVDFSIDNGTSWQVITDSISADTEHFEWLVPATLSAQCFVKVTSLRNSANFTVNSSAFVIRNKPVNIARYSFFDNVIADVSNPTNIIMPGNIINFKVKVLNNSGVDLSQLTISLVSKNSDIQVINAISTFPALLNNVEQWADLAFSVQLPTILPIGGQYSFQLIGSSPLIVSDFWLGNFILPILERFPFMVVDDDNIGDSNGNGNRVLENGETIEFMPKITNKSDETIYYCSGKLTSQHSFITFWNNVLGVDGMVYDTAFYNGMQPILPHATGKGSTSGRDFVFDYTSPQTYKTDFVLEMTGFLVGNPGIDWQTGGYKLKWGVPIQLNSSSPNVGVYLIQPSVLDFDIIQNDMQDFILLKTNFKNVNLNNLYGRIYNLQGQLISVFSINNAVGEQLIDCQLIPKGIYFMEISNQKARTAKKFMIN